jgi:GR25 family glycosyltransferase involved in LPS biosynthesis
MFRWRPCDGAISCPRSPAHSVYQPYLHSNSDGSNTKGRKIGREKEKERKTRIKEGRKKEGWKERKKERKERKTRKKNGRRKKRRKEKEER